MGISLISLGNWAKCWIFILFYFKKRVKAHFLPYIYNNWRKDEKNPNSLYKGNKTMHLCYKIVVNQELNNMCGFLSNFQYEHKTTYIPCSDDIVDSYVSIASICYLTCNFINCKDFFFLLYYLGTSNYSHKKKWNQYLSLITIT